MADMIAGLYGAMATVIAVRDIERNGGKGQVIDLSLLESIFSILGPEAAIHRVTGKKRRRVGSASEQSSPRNVYKNRSEEHTSELQSLMRISYAVFCLKKKKH